MRLLGISLLAILLMLCSVGCSLRTPAPSVLHVAKGGAERVFGFRVSAFSDGSDVEQIIAYGFHPKEHAYTLAGRYEPMYAFVHRWLLIRRKQESFSIVLKVSEPSHDEVIGVAEYQASLPSVERAELRDGVVTMRFDSVVLERVGHPEDRVVLTGHVRAHRVSGISMDRLQAAFTANLPLQGEEQ